MNLNQENISLMMPTGVRFTSWSYWASAEYKLELIISTIWQLSLWYAMFDVGDDNQPSSPATESSVKLY